MAVLPDADRQRISTGLQRYWSTLWEWTNFLKANLLAAVNAADSWVDSNAASYNTALPQPFRNNATSAQKALLLCVVVATRVSVNFAKRLIGEVD